MIAEICETDGCFEATEGTPHCELCLDGSTPEKRGPVTNRELLYARRLGGRDAAVTRARLEANGQSAAYLDASGSDRR